MKYASVIVLVFLLNSLGAGFGAEPIITSNIKTNPFAVLNHLGSNALDFMRGQWICETPAKVVRENWAAIDAEHLMCTRSITSASSNNPMRHEIFRVDDGSYGASVRGIAMDGYLHSTGDGWLGNLEQLERDTTSMDLRICTSGAPTESREKQTYKKISENLVQYTREQPDGSKEIYRFKRVADAEKK